MQEGESQMVIFWAMKEFVENHGVVYVDGADDILWEATELIESGMVREYGSKVRGLFARMGGMMVGGASDEDRLCL